MTLLGTTACSDSDSNCSICKSILFFLWDSKAYLQHLMQLIQNCCLSFFLRVPVENKNTSIFPVHVPVSVCLSCGVWKKLQTPCAQMTEIFKGELREWTCFPAVSPVVGLFVLFLVPLLCSQLLPFWVQGPAHNLLWTLSITSDQAIIPGWLRTQWESIIFFMNGHVCLLNVTMTYAICCTKALFVCL